MDTPQATLSALWKNAVCLVLTLRKLGIKRTVRQDVLAVETDRALVKVTKAILACPEYKEITKLDAQIRKRLSSYTLPSSLRPGIYLVPNALLEEVDELITNFKEKRESLIDYFVQVYPQRREEAQLKLADLYNPADYPDVDTVKAGFLFECQYLTFDLPGTLSAVSERLLTRETETVSQKVRQMLEDAKTTLREAMAELVDHLMERLTPNANGKAKTFKAGTVTNLMDFLNRFDARNLSQDVDLQKLVNQAKGLLSGMEPSRIRKDESVATVVREGMRAIKSQLDALLVEKPSRVYVLEDE